MADIDAIRRERADRIEQLRTARERARSENRARMPETAAIIDAFTEVFGPVKVAWAIEGDQTLGNPPPDEIERHRRRREEERALREVRGRHIGAGEQTIARPHGDQTQTPVRPVRPPAEDRGAPHQRGSEARVTARPGPGPGERPGPGKRTSRQARAEASGDLFG